MIFDKFEELEDGRKIDDEEEIQHESHKEDDFIKVPQMKNVPKLLQDNGK
jgi:hypothetical protein